MRVLVACEESQRVCKAFLAKGHDAWSCDLRYPSGGRFDRHIRKDVLTILNDGWDLIIAHPPCTYLTYAATRHWNNPGRDILRKDAFDFFMKFINAPVS